MSDHPAQSWRATLRGALLTARKERDAIRTAALRSALSAIDNAETPDGPVPVAGAIAETASGLGAAEVARRALADTEIRALLATEIDERLTAAETIAAGGRPERAEELRAEAAVIAEVLAER